MAVAAMSPSEAYDAASRSGALIVDMRPEHEVSYRVFDVPGTICIPRGEIAERAGELPRGRLLIVADSVGLHSRAAAEVLSSAGLGPVASLTGGMVDWERDGLPVRKDPDFELRGQCGCKLRSKKG